MILLDLNYTLVSNSDAKIRPFRKQIEGEEYRLDLIGRLSGRRVALVTARPGLHRDATMASISRKCGGWSPDEDHFNEGLPPPMWKERVLLGRVLDRFSPGELLAIESNPRTRRMYEGYDVRTCTFDDPRLDAWLRQG